MKAETADYLAKARVTLRRRADRSAALAARCGPRSVLRGVSRRRGLHFRTDRQSGDHASRRAQQFARLARGEPGIDRKLTRFLATAYQLKATADYGIGPTAAPISAD
jgi:hypothetical protein